MAKSANDEVWMDWPAGDVLGIRKKDRLGNTVRAAVCARDGYRCRYCGVVCMDAPSRGQYLRTGPWPDHTRTIDHVVPRSRGGPTTLAQEAFHRQPQWGTMLEGPQARRTRRVPPGG